MRKLILCLFLVPFAANAATAFFKYEINNGGMTKICVYNHLGSDYAITIPSYQVCPVTIRVP